MIADLTPLQRALADYMSDLSEAAYSAGWQAGLEYGLWDAVLGRSNRYGRLQIGNAEVARLRQLAERCAGWVVFDDTNQETWLPMNEWEQRFEAWVQRGRPGAE